MSKIGGNENREMPPTRIKNEKKGKGGGWGKREKE